MVMQLIANNLMNGADEDYASHELWHLLNLQYQWGHEENCEHLDDHNTKTSREKQNTVFNAFRTKCNSLDKESLTQMYSPITALANYI